jgi:hypothetical protein
LARIFAPGHPPGHAFCDCSKTWALVRRYPSALTRKPVAEHSRFLPPSPGPIANNWTTARSAKPVLVPWASAREPGRTPRTKSQVQTERLLLLRELFHPLVGLSFEATARQVPTVKDVAAHSIKRGADCGTLDRVIAPARWWRASRGSVGYPTAGQWAVRSSGWFRRVRSPRAQCAARVRRRAVG